MVWIIFGGGLPTLLVTAGSFVLALQGARSLDPGYGGGYRAVVE